MPNSQRGIGVSISAFVVCLGLLVVFSSGIASAQFVGFTLSANPPTVYVAGGGVARFTITLTPSGGFSSPVTLQLAGLSPAMRYTWTQNPVQVSGGKPSTTTLSVIVGSNSPFGSVNLQVSATGGGVTRQTSAVLIVTKVLIDRSQSSASRVNVGSVQHVAFHLSWAHDGISISGATLSLNASSAKTNATGWADFPVTSPVVARLAFVPFAVDAAGVQSYQLLSSIPSVIWDRIRVDSYPVDRRVDIGTRQSIAARVLYEYDRAPITAGDGQVFINGQAAVYSLSLGAWYVEAQLNGVGSLQFGVTRIVETTIGLTQVYDFLSPITVVWDTVNIKLEREKEFVDAGTRANIRFTGHYLYDNTEFVGTVGLNDTTTKQKAGRVFYTVTSIDDTAYGLTRFSGNVVAVTFDRLLVVDAGGPVRAQVGRTETIWFKIVYESDNTAFSSLHGSVSVNGSSLTWSGQSQRWELRTSSSQVTRHTYNITGIDDRFRDLRFFFSASGPRDVIWDKLRVVSTYISKTQQKTSAFMTVNLYFFNWTMQRVFPVVVSAYVVHAFDGSPLIRGQVFINDSRSLHENRTHLWVSTFASRNEGNFTFRVSSVVDSQYGITTFEDITRPISVQFIAAPSMAPYLLALSPLIPTAIFRFKKEKRSKAR